MAITTVSSHVVSVNAIQGTLIADNAITAVHIATNAVSGTLIADNAVTAVHVAQNSITVTQLADDCVESDKIADGVITTNHLNKAMISSQTEVTAVAGDFVLLGDTSDSNNLKKAPVSSLAPNSLPLAGGTMSGAITMTKSSGDLHNQFVSSAGDSKLSIVAADSKDAWINLSGATNEMSIGYERTSSEFRVANSDTLASNVRLAINSSTGNAVFAGNITTTGEIIGGLYKVGSTTVIDGSRNLTNIGTIVTSGTASIGTSSTLGTLNVYHSTAPKISLGMAGGGGNGGSIDFNLIAGNVSVPLTAQIRGIDDNSFRQHLIFATKTSGTEDSGMTERMRLKSDGKLGINDNDASQMLSVSGTSSVAPGRFTATGNTNTLEVWGNSTASTSTGLLCNAGTNSNDYSAKFRNYAGSTIMEVRGDSVIDIFGTTRLQDNNVLAFGQSSDCRISYDGTDALNITATAGTATQITITAAQIRPRTDLYVLNNSANNKNQLVAQNGAIKLYYDGGQKLETTSIGVSVSGNVISSSDGGSSSAFFLAGTTAGASNSKVAVGLRDGMIQMRDPGDYYHKLWYYDGVNVSTNQVHGHFRVWGDSDNSGRGNSSAENTLRLSVDTVNGNIGTSEGGSEIVSGSDSRLKTNVQNLPSMLAKVNALRPVSFDWKYTAEEEFLYGFIAQEVQAIDSTLIYDYGTTYYRNDKTYAEDKTPDGEIENTLAIYERQLIPMLVKALQEADDKIDALTARLDNAGL